MPPSGYNQQQTNYLRNFLSSCFDSLCEEVKTNNEDTLAGLKREIRSINRILDKDLVAEYERSVLNLTRKFYELMLSELSKGNLETKKVKSYVLDAFVENIRLIHVPSV